VLITTWAESGPFRGRPGVSKLEARPIFAYCPGPRKRQKHVDGSGRLSRGPSLEVGAVFAARPAVGKFRRRAEGSPMETRSCYA
jgi:hypothetical protein